ncbi:MAG: hypothetical protein F6K14_23745 [Symploca sp. SIO2C1]|nr:hypothetical protein [Symploca sp. SIO2C1]
MGRVDSLLREKPFQSQELVAPQDRAEEIMGIQDFSLGKESALREMGSWGSWGS